MLDIRCIKNRLLARKVVATAFAVLFSVGAVAESSVSKSISSTSSSSMVGSSVAAAATNSSEAAQSSAEQLSTRLDAIETFLASFVQTITDPDGNQLQQVKGKLLVKKPGLFYWQVEPPYEQFVVANQKTLWVYDPDLEQVTISDRKKLDNTPAQILSGDFSSMGNKYRVDSKVNDGSISYSLVAVDGDVSTFTSIHFVFDGDGVLASMTLIDKLDQKTQVDLSQQQTNKPIKDSQFDFVAPEGTDIIRND